MANFEGEQCACRKTEPVPATTYEYLRRLQAEAPILPERQESPASANAVQVGGGHYKDLAIQPWDYSIRNGLPWAEGEVVKYVTRWRSKGGAQDLEKARHILDKLIEVEAERNPSPPAGNTAERVPGLER